jgi:hypothetical protein
MHATRAVLVSALLVGCRGPALGGGDSSAVDTDAFAWDPPWHDDTATPDAVTDVIALSGTLHWHVDFDADAEAAGYADCDYERTYTNGVEFRDSPWLCPSCDAMVMVDSEMTLGRDDCYAQISPNDPPPSEVLGWGGDRFFRTYYANYGLSDQGVAVADGASLTTSNETPFQFQSSDGANHAATFTTSGDFAVGTTQADPMRGLHPPETYDCGWPAAHPPAWTGSYALAVGETLPDGVFRDVCNDPVRLHDELGRWLVVEVSAKDCGPCQAMADGEPAFEAAMHANGIEVGSVTLLAPTLSDPLRTSTRDDLYDWAFAFDLDGPVLADRGYGISVIGAAAPALAGEDFGFPTWVVVDPQGAVVGVHVGFASWDDVAAVIGG